MQGLRIRTLHRSVAPPTSVANATIAQNPAIPSSPPSLRALHERPLLAPSASSRDPIQLLGSITSEPSYCHSAPVMLVHDEGWRCVGSWTASRQQIRPLAVSIGNGRRQEERYYCNLSTLFADLAECGCGGFVSGVELGNFITLIYVKGIRATDSRGPRLCLDHDAGVRHIDGRGDWRHSSACRPGHVVSIDETCAYSLKLLVSISQTPF